MFYFTCNESKIYESFTFLNKLLEKNDLFTIFKFFEMYLYKKLTKALKVAGGILGLESI